MQLNFPPQPVAYCFINAYKKTVQKREPARIQHRPSRDVYSLFMLVVGLVGFSWGAVVLSSLSGSSEAVS